MFKNKLKMLVVSTFLMSFAMAVFMPINVKGQTSTTTEGFIYLSQVPYTGFGDVVRMMGFVILIALWSVLIVALIKNDKVKTVFKRMFRNVDEDRELAVAGGGYVFDVSGNQVLNMNMNPVLDALPTGFITKHEDNRLSEEFLHNKAHVSVEEEHSNDFLKANVPSDLTTDVNAFMNLIVRGEASPVFEHIRRMKSKGVSAGDFAANVVLELDAAYRAKQEGENNKRNIVLSQVVSHWSRPKIESVMGALLTIVDNSYADSTVGTKVALMRIMRS